MVLKVMGAVANGWMILVVKSQVVHMNFQHSELPAHTVGLHSGPAPALLPTTWE